MNFNFSSFLNGSLRILNIANKTLPLIKEAAPAINNIKQKYSNFKPKTTKKDIQELPYQSKNKNSHYTNNVTLPTFFK